MNILPKKRWHVRTKDNIARVRRDEAEAREQEEKRLEKLKFAESEARINFLRRQSGLPERQNVSATEVSSTPSSNTEHIDLFADFKSHVKTSNKELEKEQKTEREKYEKQIGYLTYLGQDTNEALKLRSWYEVAPSRSNRAKDDYIVTEKDLKTKFSHDPLTLINALLPNDKKSCVTSKPKATNTSTSSDLSISCANKQTPAPSISEHPGHKKHKKDKKSKKHKKKEKSHKKDEQNKYHKRKIELEAKQQEKRDFIERLRKERLKREKSERSRQDELLKPREAIEIVQQKKSDIPPRMYQKYNSQFNPELAKQNIN